MTTPIAHAADRAFAMAGVGRDDVDVASIYDCYTITVLMSLEDAGFCPKGTGMTWLTEHDLTYRGDFPLNTAGGQLSFGQAGMAGGMHHVVDAARQVMGRADYAQVTDCHTAFVAGTGTGDVWGKDSTNGSANTQATCQRYLTAGSQFRCYGYSGTASNATHEGASDNITGMQATWLGA